MYRTLKGSGPSGILAIALAHFGDSPMKGLDPLLTSIRNAILKRGKDFAPLVCDVSEIVDAFIATRPNFGKPSPFAEASPSFHGDLLYEDPQTGFIAVLMSWRGGAQTPIHDHHGTWGVMGVLEGHLQLTNFIRLRDHYVKPAAKLTAGPGDVTWILPPDLEIHSIRNPFPRPARSLHIYGANIGF